MKRLFQMIKVSVLVVLMLPMDVLLQSNVYAVSDTLKVHFIDVSIGTQFRGDATLIDCGGKYVLVDGGTKDTYNKLYEYLNRFRDRDMGKIMLEAVVISHNHPDHFGGVLEVLRDTKNFHVKTIYRTNIFEDTAIAKDRKSRIDKACITSKAKDVIMKVGEYKELKLNGTKVTIYGPAMNFFKAKASQLPTEYRKGTSNAVNDSSMIVDIQGPKDDVSNFSAILLGDLLYHGLAKAVDTRYTNKDNKSKQKRLFKKGTRYGVCQFGHHGLKLYDGKLLNEEVELYNKYINADNYVFTSDREYIKGMSETAARGYSNAKNGFAAAKKSANHAKEMVVKNEIKAQAANEKVNAANKAAKEAKKKADTAKKKANAAKKRASKEKDKAAVSKAKKQQKKYNNQQKKYIKEQKENEAKSNELLVKQNLYLRKQVQYEKTHKMQLARQQDFEEIMNTYLYDGHFGNVNEMKKIKKGLNAKFRSSNQGSFQMYKKLNAEKITVKKVSW